MFSLICSQWIFSFVAEENARNTLSIIREKASGVASRHAKAVGEAVWRAQIVTTLMMEIPYSHSHNSYMIGSRSHVRVVSVNCVPTWSSQRREGFTAGAKMSWTWLRRLARSRCIWSPQSSTVLVQSLSSGVLSQGGFECLRQSRIGWTKLVNPRSTSRSELLPD